MKTTQELALLSSFGPTIEGRIARLTIDPFGKTRDILVGRVLSNRPRLAEKTDAFIFSTVDIKKPLAQFLEANSQDDAGYEEWAVSYLDKYLGRLNSILHSFELVGSVQLAHVVLGDELKKGEAQIHSLQAQQQEIEFRESNSTIKITQILVDLLKIALSNRTTKNIDSDFEKILIALQQEIVKTKKALEASIANRPLPESDFRDNGEGLTEGELDFLRLSAVLKGDPMSLEDLLGL